MSGYYPSAQAALSDVAVAIIIIAILYYVVVLITEVYGVVSESAREAAMLRRRRSSKVAGGSSKEGSPSPKEGSSRGMFSTALGISDATAQRRASAANGEMNTGKLDVALNPLFLNSSGGASSSGSGDALSSSALDTVRSFANAPPPLELWRMIAANYEELFQQNTSLVGELNGMKQKDGRNEMEDDGGAARATGGVSSRNLRNKTAFNPAMAASSADGGAVAVGTGNPLAGLAYARSNNNSRK